MLLLAALAAAHVPHAVLAGAVTGDVWFALYDGGETSVLYRSADAGHTWAALPAAPTVEPLYAIARLGDGRVFLAGQERLWGSADGVAWESRTLRSPAVRMGASADELVLGLEGAVLVGPPEALVLHSGAWAALGGGATPVWVDADGAVHLGEAAFAGPVGAERVQSVHAGASDVWLGTVDGEVWRGTEAEGWWACGALPVEAEHPEVAALAEGRAVGADGTLYEAQDDCASWREVRTPYRVDFGGSGGAESVTEAVSAFAVGADATLIAGWDGLVRGPEWAQERVLPPDFVRDLALGADGAVYAAGLTGVMRSFDGGATWDAPHLGGGDANVQRVATDPADARRLAAVLNHQLYLSSDRGRSFQALTTPFSAVAEVAWTGVLWASGDGRLARWDGATWTEVASDTRGTWLDGDALCWVSDGVTRCSRDDGATVEVRPEPDLLATAGPVGLQEHAVLYDGVEVLRLEDDTFRHLARLDGGAWFASTRGAAVWTSADGVGWSALELALPAAPVRLTPAGDTLLLSTYDGGFALRDGALERFAAWQLVKGASGFDDCDACTLAEDDCASQGYLTRVEGSFAVDLRGTTVRVVEASGAGRLVVDGVAAAGWQVDVPAGWHEVRVEGPARFDHVEGITAGAVLAPADTPAVDPCAAEAEVDPTDDGCGGCGGSGASALLLLPAGWLRRRRGRGVRAPVAPAGGMV